jgi:hypothetical protein
MTKHQKKKARTIEIAMSENTLGPQRTTNRPTPVLEISQPSRQQSK